MFQQHFQMYTPSLHLLHNSSTIPVVTVVVSCIIAIPGHRLSEDISLLHRLIGITDTFGSKLAIIDHFISQLYVIIADKVNLYRCIGYRRYG